MKNEIFEYIKNRKYGKIGIIVARNVDGQIRVGWSKCNFKLGDEFVIGDGMAIALDRTDVKNLSPAPACIHRQIRKVGARAIRYFKDATSFVLPPRQIEGVKSEKV